MSFYVKGNDLIAYDVIPPLDVVGSDAYRKNYETFLAAYDGPITSEFRDLRIIASSRIAFVHSLERVSGTLKGGQKSELWVRATSGLRKINGKWLIVHDHISVPADFDTGKAVLDSKPGH
jgi:ketosteroid isomerase-like protein